MQGHATEPEMLGQYRLDAIIGEGGMGRVHRAFDTVRNRTVALKLLNPALAGDPHFQARFRREAELTARLSSPHVIPIHDFGRIGDDLFIDMRLVPGIDLAETVARSGPLAPSRAIEIVRQLSDALDAAHAAGLVHRDVKPSNVLITSHRGHDFAYLVDFGIVRSLETHGHTSLTTTGSMIGTPHYMAPEMLTGGTIGPAADVYALGCLLFEILTGRAPFAGDGIDVLYQHIHAMPPRPTDLRPDLPAELDRVVARAMAKDPQDRPSGAGDLADAAGRAAAGTAPHTTLARPAGPAVTRAPAPDLPAAPPAPRNDVARSAVWLGVAAVVSSVLPFVNILLGTPLVILGLVASFRGLALCRRGEATNHGTAVAGLVLAMLAVCIGLAVDLGNAIALEKQRNGVQSEIVLTSSGPAHVGHLR